MRDDGTIKFGCTETLETCDVASSFATRRTRGETSISTAQVPHHSALTLPSRSTAHICTATFRSVRPAQTLKAICRKRLSGWQGRRHDAQLAVPARLAGCGAWSKPLAAGVAPLKLLARPFKLRSCRSLESFFFLPVTFLRSES